MADIILLPRPTRSSQPYNHVVGVDGDRAPDKCIHCGEDIVFCGFECEFTAFIHVSGSRHGSHKCGKNYRDLNASP